MVKTWRVRIPKLTGSETRKAYIYLPTSYEKNPDKRYPVLYMFDGQNVFFDSEATYGKSWGLKDYLDFTDTELIVAAVECNSSPDNARLSEYAPYTFIDPEFGRFEGRGKIYMDWLVRTFKRNIDKNYRTIPDREHTFIAGSSMGGLMSLYALMQYNRYFSKAAALSPSLMFNDRQLMALIHRANLDPNTTLYMDFGSQEFGLEGCTPWIFENFCNAVMRREIFITYRIVPGGTHCEASWEKQLPFMIHTLMYNI